MYGKNSNTVHLFKKEDAFIPFMGGRPARETVISKDDILNLIITLNTTSDSLDLVQGML
jgi:hypothetical protein